MADVKRVFYVKYLAHNNFIEILGRRSDIEEERRALREGSPRDGVGTSRVCNP